MAAKIKVLILDDEEKWLKEHSYQLSQRGYDTVCTRYAKEALEIIKNDTDKKIKAVIIDEILYEPNKINQLQTKTGTDVLCEIKKIRSDIVRIMVSAAPEKKRGSENVLKEDRRLQKYSDKVFPKCELNDDYSPLIEYLKEKLANRIYQKGNMYVINFRGSIANVVNNTKGMEHIVYLIKNQGQNVYCTTLHSKGELQNNPNYSQMSTEELDGEGLKVGNERQNYIIDEKTKNAVKKKMKELKELKGELEYLNKEEEIEKIDSKIKKLEDYLKEFGHRFYDLKKDSKDAVIMAINRTLDEIKKQHLELYEHLHPDKCGYLKIDWQCSYSPPDFIKWEVVD